MQWILHPSLAFELAFLTCAVMASWPATFLQGPGAATGIALINTIGSFGEKMLAIALHFAKLQGMHELPAALLGSAAYSLSKSHIAITLLEVDHTVLLPDACIVWCRRHGRSADHRCAALHIALN